ncbi:site-specific DNA-methyltransferase [Thermoanaerobacterium sp. R66]|uniref:site-specific DNA-methyltransferase n=1 Tax=Thermoanaerobacterium sp. R66 TaxID=2742479 RepID=UPI002380C330|nr:site-specific DNA-methyltransferase [Thermoanaerobacterium sp. R66]MDE4542417.1 site-specific DNA-methyltransferase [Thermoanaerobacterium sp. R66]
MNKSYEKLVTLLKQMFQMDQADLDFGIYRIMNYKRKEIEKFLNEDLLPQVREQLEKYISVRQKNLKKELEDLKKILDETGVPYENSAKYVAIKNELESGMDIGKIEDEVYSHLTDFFSRYYNNGDFISQRRYKEGVYAIPYEGEEVKLYWANADQYYIKTTEYFRDYTFTLPDGKRVHFKLVEASTDKDNNKPPENKERRFVLYEDEPVKVENGELIIQFEYKVHESKQKDLNDKTIKKITDIFATGKGIYTPFFTILTPSPTEANPRRTLLEKHLNDYTARNTFDYFIHKDLGGFLRRELDFYLKNEVMFLDDLDTEHEIRVEQYITKIKVIKNIGYKIIAFLEQIENFQKKLWLKKKFVVETNYCITLDRINEKFYPEIAANKAQVEEWKKLFAIDELEGYSEPLTVEFLKANPYLVLDTAFFGEEFKERLIQNIDNIDEKTDGLLIKSENFQALNLLLERYKEQVKCVYIDPPYNTSEETFIYKNSYKHSSWIAMLNDRIALCKKYFDISGALLVTIDDEELYNLKKLLDDVFSIDKYIGTIVIQSNPRGRGINSHFATSHEYCLCYSISPDDLIIIDQPLTEEQENEYRNEDEISQYRILPFRRSGGLSSPDERPNSEFSIYYDVTKQKIVGVGGPRIRNYPSEYEPEYVLTLEDNGSIVQLSYEEFMDKNDSIIISIMPIDTDGRRRVWRWSDRQKVLEAAKRGDFIVQKIGDSYNVYLKDRIKEGRKPKTVWVDSKYDSSSHGTNLLQDIFGGRKIFGYPKSVYSTLDSLHSIIGEDYNAIIIDFFAGSGTTGHAVINLNREDGGNRKYILVEMGEYFDTVLKPRIQKVIYSKDWKDGKPVSREGISHMFKYLKLESYEDALNNLEIRRSEEQQMVMDLNKDLREQYMLSYMLDKETEGSMSLLNIDQFVNPFGYKMKIANGLETKETAIDLVETFNYLLGLVVTRIEAKESFNTEPDKTSDMPGAVRLVPAKDGKGEYTFKEIEGHTLSGDKVLIIWRTLTGEIAKDNAAMDAYFRKKKYSTQDFEYDRIYVNGDNNLQNMKQEGEQWKVLLIEEEFKRLMLEVPEF